MMMMMMMMMMMKKMNKKIKLNRKLELLNFATKGFGLDCNSGDRTYCLVYLLELRLW